MMPRFHSYRRGDVLRHEAFPARELNVISAPLGSRLIVCEWRDRDGRLNTANLYAGELMQILRVA